ncbi:hypothetical protein ABPG75_002493 [Micractinium tetrahymenae]
MVSSEGAGSPGRKVAASFLARLAGHTAAPEPSPETESACSTDAAAAQPRWTSRLPSLPALRRRRASSSAASLPARPVERIAVPLQLAGGQEAVVQATADSSLEDVHRECERAAGVPAPLLSFVVQERPLASSLHSLAHSVSSRHHLRRQLADWSSFLLLPEGVRRELRGQGLGGWVQQHVLERLQGPRQAPPGTVWVQVATLDGARHPLLLSAAATLGTLRSEVQQATGVPPTQQQLAVVAHEPPGRTLRVLRLLAVALLALCAWLAAALRWLLGLPPPGRVRVTLQTAGGRELELAVSPDTTLREVQQLAWERHGEQISLQQLSLSPSRRSSTRDDKGGAAASSSSIGNKGGSPAKRRLPL